MNEEKSEQYFLNFLTDEFGGWPILKYNESNRLSSVEILKKIHIYDNDILFKFEIEQDPNNSTEKNFRVIFIIYVICNYINI
jgi:hypothetical protein